MLSQWTLIAEVVLAIAIGGRRQACHDRESNLMPVGFVSRVSTSLGSPGRDFGIMVWRGVDGL